jgi:hypothetical protein
MASKKNSRKKVSKKVAKTTSKVGHMTYKLGDLFYVGKDLQTMEVAFINAGKAFMKPIGGFIVEAVLDERGYDRKGVPAVALQVVEKIGQEVVEKVYKEQERVLFGHAMGSGAV